MSAEFETRPMDPIVIVGTLEKIDRLRREFLCEVKITAVPHRSAWHVGIKCPTTGLLHGASDLTLPEAWARVSEEWFAELEKRVAGVTRKDAGIV